MTDYSQLVPLSTILPINVNLSSATEPTMISILGSPQMPLTTNDQPNRASPLVKKLLTEKTVSHVQMNGIAPAVDSLVGALTAAFAANPGLSNVLEGNGMLAVRLRHPTSGVPSTKISNHAWGTAIDFRLHGQPSPGNTHDKIPLYIAALVPHLHTAGWYSGIAFHDTMHFEVAEETIKTWSAQGKFDVPTVKFFR